MFHGYAPTAPGQALYLGLEVRKRLPGDGRSLQVEGEAEEDACFRSSHLALVPVDLHLEVLLVLLEQIQRMYSLMRLLGLIKAYGQMFCLYSGGYFFCYLFRLVVFICYTRESQKIIRVHYSLPRNMALVRVMPI